MSAVLSFLLLMTNTAERPQRSNADLNSPHIN
jgi:hypothetical protein